MSELPNALDMGWSMGWITHLPSAEREEREMRGNKTRLAPGRRLFAHPIHRCPISPDAGPSVANMPHTLTDCNS